MRNRSLPRPSFASFASFHRATRAVVPLALAGAITLAPLGTARAKPASPPGKGCDMTSPSDDSAPLILDPQATLTESGEPVVSVLVENPAGVGNVSGKVHITQPNGHSIGSNSTAEGTVPSGNRLTYRLPDGTLERNQPFRWTLDATNTATGASSCYASGPGRHPFTPIRPDPHSGSDGQHLTRMPIRVTPADGALLVGWGRPMAWPGGGGNADQSNGFTAGGTYSYTVTAVAPGGQVAAQTTAHTTRAVLSGLDDGTRYAVHIRAHRTDADGASTDMADSWSAGEPVAVPSGRDAYAEAVKDLLNAENGLQNGTYPTTAAALAGTGADRFTPTCNCGPSITSWLTAHTAGDRAIGAVLANSNQKLTEDGSKLSNTVVAASPDGRTITVHAIATRSFTTVDTSGNDERRFPGSEQIPVSYTFTLNGEQAELTGYAADDSLIVPVTDDSFETMTSTDAVTSPDSPKQVSTDPATGMFVPANGAASPQVSANATVLPDDHTGYLPGIAAWAEENAFGSYNGYGNDCTDFASRAMNQGGGMPMNVPDFPLPQHTDDSYWFQGQYIWGLHVSSYSWGGAWHLANYLWGQGSQFLSYTNQAVPGDIIWANWSGSSWNGISHAGVVTGNDGTNLYITQHSNSRINEPLYLVSDGLSWSQDHPDLHVWIAAPYEKN